MRTYIVTGCNKGIGKEIVTGILNASPDNKVIMGVRDEEKGNIARKEILASDDSLKEGNVEVFKLDCSSKQSIENFVKKVSTSSPQLHCLVNNASIGEPKTRAESVDGVELVFATNVLGYFYLTQLLSDSLIAGKPSRIVNVASEFAGDFEMDDLEFKRRPYNNISAYKQSKMANRMLTYHFSKIFQAEEVTVNACNPGLISTDLLLPLQLVGEANPQEGAQTPIMLATKEDLAGVSGTFWYQQEECGDPFQYTANDNAELFTICENMMK